jgi:thiamine transport system permease protein
VALLAAAPVVFLMVCYLWPVVTLVGEVVSGSTIADTLERGGVWRVLWFTTWQAVVSTLATVAAGLAPAWLLARWSFPGRRLLAAVVVVPFLLPTVVVGAAFTSLLPDALVGTATAVVIAHVYFNLSVVVRLVGALWEQLPPDLTAAARTLGASPWQAARSVTLPLLRPAIASAAMVTFLFTFTSYGVVAILGGPANATLEVEIARRATGLGDIGGAAVLSLLQLGVLAVGLALGSVVQRRATTRWAVSPTTRQWPTTAAQRFGVGVLAAATAVVTLAPIAALAVSSLRTGRGWSLAGWRALWGGTSDTRPGSGVAVDVWGALGASLRFAVLATAVSVLIGGLATLAIGAARRHGRLLDVGLMLPLATSAVTIGFGMLITFDTTPFDWRDEPWLVPLGHALVAVPFVVRAALPVLRARPTGWLDAAATLGASPTRAWWEIDVGLLRRPLAVGAAFAAAISLGEFGATTLLSRSGQETLPTAIARLLGRAGDIPRAEASALAVVLAVACTLLLLVASGGRDARRA